MTSAPTHAESPIEAPAVVAGAAAGAGPPLLLAALSAERVLALQRTAGNAAVSRLLGAGARPPAARVLARVDDPLVAARAHLRRQVWRQQHAIIDWTETEREGHARIGGLDQAMGLLDLQLMPPVSMWDPVLTRARAVDRALAEIDAAADVAALERAGAHARTLLKAAAEAYNSAHRRYFHFREGTIAGAEHGMITVEVSIAAALAVATAGATTTVTGAILAGAASSAFAGGMQEAGTQLSEHGTLDLRRLGVATLREGLIGAAGGAVGAGIGAGFRRVLAREVFSAATLAELGIARSAIETQGSRLLGGLPRRRGLHPVQCGDLSRYPPAASALRRPARDGAVVRGRGPDAAHRRRPHAALRGVGDARPGNGGAPAERRAARAGHAREPGARAAGRAQHIDPPAAARRRSSDATDPAGRAHRGAAVCGRPAGPRPSGAARPALAARLGPARPGGLRTREPGDPAAQRAAAPRHPRHRAGHAGRARRRRLGGHDPALGRAPADPPRHRDATRSAHPPAPSGHRSRRDPRARSARAPRYGRRRRVSARRGRRARPDRHGAPLGPPSPAGRRAAAHRDP